MAQDRKTGQTNASIIIQKQANIHPIEPQIITECDFVPERNFLEMKKAMRKIKKSISLNVFGYVQKIKKEKKKVTTLI